VKKILNILVLVILCCSLAIASNENAGNQQGNQAPVCQGTACQAGQTERVQQMSQVQGLENAMLRVRTQERVQHLNQVMIKIQTHRRAMLNNLTNLEITEDDDDEVTATGKREGRLFGFLKVQRRLRYNIDSEGNVERVRAWHEFMWKKNQEID